MPGTIVASPPPALADPPEEIDMTETRWLRWVGPGLLAVTALGAAVTGAMGAAGSPWEPQACDVAAGEDPSALATTHVSFAEFPQQPWFRVDPRIDRNGELEGQRLSLGLDLDRAGGYLDLSPESFAAGPFGRNILVGSDDGTTSQLQLVDVARGCTRLVATEADVIRRATIDPAGRTMYEMRVDRATREDLGIWARALDVPLAPVRVLGPIPNDGRFGPTFSTEFAWDQSGDRLAIQSCGEDACRTRVLDRVRGDVTTLTEMGLGTMIGLEGSSLIAYAACPGLPCPILAIDLVSGDRTTIAASASTAILATTPDGTRLVHEVFNDASVRLRAVTLDGANGIDLGALDGDLRLQPAARLADASTVVPDGWVVLAPEGRLPANGPASRVQLRHATDGTTVQLDGVIR